MGLIGNTRWFSTWRRVCWSVLLLLGLVTVACSNGDSLSAGKAGKGETLTVTIHEVRRVQEIRFQGGDQKHYLVLPSSRDKELVTLHLQVYNGEATRVLMTVDEEAAELRGFEPNEKYPLVDLYLSPEELLEKNVKEVQGSHPDEGLYDPFIAGPIELPQKYSVQGWVVFEVPTGTKLKEMRWGAGDTVFVGR